MGSKAHSEYRLARTVTSKAHSGCRLARNKAHIKYRLARRRVPGSTPSLYQRPISAPVPWCLRYPGQDQFLICHKRAIVVASKAK